MGALASQAGRKLRRLAAEFQSGTMAGKTDDLNVMPGNAMAQPRSNGLHSGLLRSKTGRQTLGGIWLPQTVPDFGWREYPLKKTVTKTLDSGFDAIHLRDVNSCAYNHLRLCSKVSYRVLIKSKVYLIF
jgi:hypothetical protein